MSSPSVGNTFRMHRMTVSRCNLNQGPGGGWYLQAHVWGNYGGIVRYLWTTSPAITTTYSLFRGAGATSRQRVDGRAHPTLPDAVPGIERGGSLPPRPHPLERHHRSCGRGATSTPPATCGIGGAHIGMAMPCTSTPMSMCTRGTPPTPADRRSRSAPRKPARAPCREPVDRRSGPRGPEQVLQLDDPLLESPNPRASECDRARAHRQPPRQSTDDVIHGKKSSKFNQNFADDVPRCPIVTRSDPITSETTACYVT